MLFVIDKFSEGGFHFREVFDEDLIVGLDFLDESVVSFDDSGDDSGHEFDDRFKFNRSLVIPLNNIILLFSDLLMHLIYPLQKFVMHCYLVVEEESILDRAFFVGDSFVILQKLQMLFLSNFNIFYYRI